MAGQAELRRWDPSFWETATTAAGNALRERGVANPQGLAEAGQAGMYLSPAAPLAFGIDLYRAGNSLADPIMKLWESYTNKNPITDESNLTREQFFSRRRRKTRGKEEILADELANLRQSQTYLEAGRKRRDILEKEAGRRAEQRFQAQSAGDKDEEAKLQADWNAELADRKRKVNEKNRQPWYVRYPGSGEVAVGLGSVVAGLMARRNFNKLSSEGNRLLEAVKAARSSGAPAAEAEAVAALDAFNKSLTRRSLWAGAKAAAVPTELRAIGTGIDATTMPEIRDEKGNIDPTSARQQAWDMIHRSFSSPAEFLTEHGPAAISGVIGSMTGASFAKPVPRDTMRAATDVSGNAKRSSEIANARISAVDDAARVRAAQTGDGLTALDEQAALAKARIDAEAQRAAESLARGSADYDIKLGDITRRAELAKARIDAAAQVRAAKAAAQPQPAQAPPAIPAAAPTPAAVLPAQGQPGVQPAPPPHNMPPSPGRQYGTYGGQYREQAQGAYRDLLASVPPGQRQTYEPDVNEVLTAVQGRTAAIAPPRDPAILQRRAKGTTETFRDIRATGGDPFSPAGVSMQLKGRENLAIPMMVTAGGAAGAGYGSLADFEQALAGFNHALVDLDGDGRPDAVINEPMGLGNRYNGGY